MAVVPQVICASSIDRDSRISGYRPACFRLVPNSHMHDFYVIVIRNKRSYRRGNLECL